MRSSVSEVTEKYIIGCLFLDESLALKIINAVPPEKFAHVINEEIFTCALKLFKAGKRISCEPVKRACSTDIVDDFEDYLLSAINDAGFGEDLDFHLDEIEKQFNKRTALTVLEGVVRDIREDDGAKVGDIVFSGSKVVLERVSGISTLLQFPFHVEGLSRDDVKAKIYDHYEDESDGIACGFYDLDSYLSKMVNSNLIILAARPSMGKTALATCIALNVCKLGKKVGMFSLEMSAKQICKRMISQVSGVSMERIQKRNLGDVEVDKITSSLSALSKGNIYIDDSGFLSVATLYAKATFMKIRHEIDFLVIDYLQLISGSARRSDGNRYLEVSEISRGLKLLAKKLDIPILCLSQLSRKVEERPNKRPMLSDLRDSGAIEQDADQVLMMYQDSYYKEEIISFDEDRDKREEPSNDNGVCEINVAKNRHGKTGVVKLYFDKECLLFKDVFQGY